jgi:hypothetical protein
MPIQSKRANDIQAYIDSHEVCNKGKQKVVIDGRVEPLESYLLPVSYLQYNHNNSRFALEIIEKENEIGRKLDMSDSEDVKIIKSLLLQDASEARSLKEDLKKLGEQTEVAAITHDGVVINGNRRMATLEELNIEEPTGKWQKLWVVRLPTNISQKDLWKIEAGLQLSKDKVAEYGPVNDLLMIKEGKTAGLSSAEIAAAMYGWKEDEVNSALERLNLIDVFLSFMKAPNNYGIIKKFRLTEHFIDIQKGLLNKLKDEGAPKKLINKKLELAFGLIRASILKQEVITHLEVRRLTKVLTDEDASLTFSDKVPEKSDIRDISIDILIDNFSNAKDVLENKKDRDKPTKLIERAIAALKGIDRSNQHYKTSPQVKKRLLELNDILNNIKEELKIK